MSEQRSRGVAQADAEAATDAAFDRLMRNLPAAVRETLSAEQTWAIREGLRQSVPRHAVDYRVSLPWFGRRVYVTLLAGPEGRSLERLRREGQVTLGRVAGTYGVVLAMVAGLMVVTGAVCVFSISKMLDDGGASREMGLRVRG